MRLLLDTQAMLWFLANDPRLSTVAESAILDPANERWLSPISLLEIAIKVRIGKPALHAPFAVLFPAQLTLNRIRLLPLAGVYKLFCLFSVTLCKSIVCESLFV